MKKPTLSTLLAIGVTAISASQADAAFHLYDFEEVFTDGTGTLQFIEMTTTSNGQQVLGGHEITVFNSANTVISQWVFPTDGPSPTANKSILLATSSFASTYGITPDFTIPDNLLLQDADYRLDFDGQDSVGLSMLPTDGVMSLNAIPNAPNDPASFSINDNAMPMNFAGDTAVVPEPSAVLLSFGALVGLALRRRR